MNSPTPSFSETISQLPLSQKVILNTIAREQPELFEYIEHLFYQKHEAIQHSDHKKIKAIYAQEKEEVVKLLNELIQETYDNGG